MLVPSVDIMQGKTVQLIGGKEKVLEAGCPVERAKAFGIAGEVAVIDLDAAMGTGSNSELIIRAIRETRVRVGGGIRSLAQAQEWLNRGAEKIIIGTAASPALLSQLPRQRCIAAVDAVNGEIVVEGWQTKTGRDIFDAIRELRECVGGFLVTFVEREGRMVGIDLDRVKAIAEAAGGTRVTVAGGVTTAEEIRTLDQLGVDAQVGMAIYTGKLEVADALSCVMNSDRADGLWPTVVCSEFGEALGLAWSNRESLKTALEKQRGVYFSRKRGIWEKGATSGASQELLRVDLDCDRDALRFTVRQSGAGFCHNHTKTCWGDIGGIPDVSAAIEMQSRGADLESYTARLIRDQDLLAAKIKEEAAELIAAANPEQVQWEAADLIYFTLVKLAECGVSWKSVVDELRRRSMQVTRRPGNAKTAENTEHNELPA